MSGRGAAAPRRGPGRSRGQTVLGGPDVGVAQILEAVTIGIVVVSATFAAVSFQSPPAPQENPATEQTESKTYSALKALDDHYIDDAGYNHSGLSEAIARAAAGNETPLVDAIEPFLPSDSSFCAYLNNGQGRIPLHCPNDPPGAAVGVAYPIEPNWRFHYAETGIKYYDRNQNPAMGLTEIPIMNAHTVLDTGDYVNVSFAGVQTWSPGQLQETANASYEENAFSTLLQGNDTSSYPSAAIYMDCRRPSAPTTTEPCYASDLTGGMTGYGPYNEGGTLGATGGTAEDTVRFTVNNSGPAAVETPTTLEIDIASGLDVNDSSAASLSGFTNVRVEGTESGVETIKADLASALAAGDEAQLEVKLNVTDTRYAFKRVDADLSGGAVSSSQMLLRVQDKNEGTFTMGDSRVAMISTPKPAGSASGSDPTPTGRWGIVLPIPFSKTTVDDLNVSLEDGEDVLHDVRWPSNFHPPDATGDKTQVNVTDGSISHGPDWLNWDPPFSDGLGYEGYTFAEFQFVVETDGSQTLASHKFPFAKPQANFHEYDPPPQSIQLEPGLWWREYPPDGETHCKSGCAGYEDDYTLDVNEPTANASIDARLAYRGLHMNGTTKYYIADLADAKFRGVRDAVQAASVSTEQRRVAPGDPMEVKVNVEDLAQYLSQEYDLQDMQLETNIFAPWGVRNRTPVETFTHDLVVSGYEAPRDLLPMYVNGDASEDVLTASMDGNVYAVSGETGEQLSGYIFPIPDASGPGKLANPTHLAHGLTDGGADVVGIGTNQHTNHFFTVDDDLDERWGARKPDGTVDTFGLTVGDDLSGDGYPEVVLSTEAENVSSASTFDQSRLTVWHGQDKGDDDEGDLYDGWGWDYNAVPPDYGTVVTGEASLVGTGKFGSQAKQGIYANTGMNVATNAKYVVNQSEKAIMEQEPKKALKESNNITVGMADAGLFGFTEEADLAFNFSGIRAVGIHTADQVPSGDASGLVMGGADGWAWGLNGTKPIYPVYGYTTLGATNFIDLEMSNRLEGYMVDPAGHMMNTRDGWTTQKPYTETVTIDGVEKLDTRVYRGLNTVDTPEASFRSDATRVSWWAGDAGTILRSTDRLKTVEEKTTTATLQGTIKLETSVDDLLGSVSNLDMTKINLTDSYAVSKEEAWFVGGGAGGTSLDGKGYIVHTTDGGSSFDAVEVECGGIGCELTSIDTEGNHIWVTGDHGLVLTHERMGQAASVSLNGTPEMSDEGRISIPLTTDQTAHVDNVTVTWDPITRLTYGEASTLDNGTGDRDLWNETKGCPDLLGGEYFTERETCSADYGYDHGNGLQVKEYVNDSFDDENRTFTEDANLTVGPFTSVSTDTLLDDPYHDRPWYNESTRLPTTWHVNLTFSDGTHDTYTIKANESFVWSGYEASEVNWTYPANTTSHIDTSTTFSVPDCFGKPSLKCPDHESINITNLGSPTSPTYVGAVASEANKAGSTLTRLAEGSLTWTNETTPNDRILYDVAVNMHDTDRWVAAGGAGTTIVSYDGGETWTLMPTGRIEDEIDQPFHAVDYTHPDVGYVTGGGGTNGLRFTLDGYADTGSATTNDLYDESEYGDQKLQKIEPNPDHQFVFNSRHGDTPVEVEVWDPGLNDGAGGWASIWDGSSWKAYEFSEATDTVKLRFDLSVEDMSRWSPMLYGNLTIDGYNKTGTMISNPLPFDVDINDTAAFASGLGSLKHDAENGYLRLKAVHNPWLERLGNPDEGPWSDVKNGTVGARVADTALAPNGSTLWVVTEGIYGMGDDETEPPVKHNANDAYDNTLYAIDVATGERESWWDPIRFDSVPQQVRVGSQAAVVSVGNSSETPVVYWVDIDNPSKHKRHTMSSNQQVAYDLAVADAFPSKGTTSEDPILSVAHLGGGTAKVHAYAGDSMTQEWTAMPSLTSRFAFHYEVPNDALYGSRIVRTHLDWTVEESTGTQLVQSGRLHDTFMVTPNGKSMPLTPTYTLEVVAWIDDW